MSWLRRLLTACLATAVLVGLSFGEARAQGDPLTTLLKYKAVLDELQRVIDHAKTNIDVSVANQLESVNTKIRGLLKQIESIEKQITKDVNNVLFVVASGTHDVLAETRRLVRSTERTAFLDVNTSLINATRIVAALPLVSVDPYLAATEPMRISGDTFDNRVYFYGYFPDVTTKDTATVRIGSQTFPLTVYAGNRLGLDLPKASLKEESFVDFVVTIPKRSWWKLRKTNIVISERIYIERAQPFEVTIRPFLQNPDIVARVGSSQPFRASANSDITSIIRDITAQDLFTSLVANASEFDLESVSLADVQHTLGGARPCDHAPMSSEFRGWSKESVKFALTAGSVGPHWHSLPDACTDLGPLGKHCVPQGFLHGGGGSHADIEIRPTFSAHRKNVAEYVPGQQSTALLRYRTAHNQPAPSGSDWRFTQIVMAFRDGSERWSEQITLFPGHESDSKPQWSAQMVGGQLTIQTR